MAQSSALAKETISSRSTILHIAPTPFFSDRGCHIRIEGVVRSLDTVGFNNVVNTYHHGRDIGGIDIRRIAAIKAYTKTAAGPSVWKPWADWKLMWLCFGNYRRTRPAVIHAHLHEGVLIGLAIKLFLFWRKTPLIADMQGCLVQELETYGFFRRIPWLKWPFRLLERGVLGCATKIVCSSQRALDNFIREYPALRGKIFLAQDGADEAVRISPERARALRAELQIPDHKTLIVYSGGLQESKGLTDLQALISDCRSHAEHVHFLIIGYPVDELRAYLRDNDLAHSCTLTGRIDFSTLDQYLAIADIAIDPKRGDAGEGSGKTLNYIASGLPVVAFDTQNNRVYLSDAAALADSREMLHDQLMKYVTNPAERHAAAGNNLARFREQFSWAITAEQLGAVYCQLRSTAAD